MSSDWVGEMRIFPYARPAQSIPAGWHICDGTLLPVSGYNDLYSVIGTQFGGNGVTNFALPDLRGRVPVHVNAADSSCAKPGQTGGTDGVQLTTMQIPTHYHMVSAVSSATGTVANPAGSVPAGVAASTTAGAPVPPDIYGSSTNNLTSLHPGSLLATGGGQAHENRQPTMALYWCICIRGFVPTKP